MAHDPLHGACSCGRNQYSIQIPDDVTEHAEVYFDSSRDNRRTHGSPITAWLRVPLDWFQSYTRSLFPDETHSSIRRIHTPSYAPDTRRIFCGFCGTPLTFWTEQPAEEADFMSISIGSLSAQDLRALEELGLLPEDSTEEEEVEAAVVPSTTSSLAPTRGQSSSVVVPSLEGSPSISRSFRRGNADGFPWFEELVEGSRLGRIMRSRRGAGVSDDQSASIEWEISEWHDDGTLAIQQEDSDSNEHAIGKRKRGRQSEVERPQKRT